MKFENNAKLKSEMAYQKLANIPEADQANIINHVLREVGTRYASRSLSKCRKTAALVHNLKAMKSHGGPKNIIKRLAKMNEPTGDKEKVEYLMKNLQFLKSKSARDFLMELGLLTNAIAFDVRVKNVLNKMGITTPEDFENDSKSYDEAENNVLTHICKPLGITGIELDRLLYQNYDEIMKTSI